MGEAKRKRDRQALSVPTVVQQAGRREAAIVRLEAQKATLDAACARVEDARESLRLDPHNETLRSAYSQALIAWGRVTGRDELANKAEIEEGGCCPFHKSGGHPHDRHGFDRAENVYGVRDVQAFLLRVAEDDALAGDVARVSCSNEVVFCAGREPTCNQVSIERAESDFFFNTRHCLNDDGWTVVDGLRFREETREIRQLEERAQRRRLALSQVSLVAVLALCVTPTTTDDKE